MLNLKEMTMEEQIVFLSKRVIKIVDNIESLNEEEKISVKKEVEDMINEPKKKDVSRLLKLSTYLEEKTLT